MLHCLDGCAYTLNPRKLIWGKLVRLGIVYEVYDILFNL